MKCKYCGNLSMLEICIDCRNKDLINNCFNAIYKDVEYRADRLSVDKDLLI